MTRTRPELATPLQISIPAGVHLAPTDLTSSAESGFEPGALSPRGRDLTTSPTKSTRGLFWDGPRKFEPRSDDEHDAWDGTPSPKFNATPAGGRLATTYDLACSRSHTRWIFSGIGFRAWIPPAPRPIPYH
ncbi:hypothetical protein AVEN_249713-1 [Araneus ventricosus]|uniref:Uncharacterized protein n=1 Tax=Araneus ventricosus TaxID=182803 RepID=A0A4Y2R3N9_ARAVE|nr:hypothetical protein AVEN_249713-1 [Araneus ventricosus]